jgi:hypothetical protein
MGQNPPLIKQNSPKQQNIRWIMNTKHQVLTLFEPHVLLLNHLFECTVGQQNTPNGPFYGIFGDGCA